MKKPVRLQMLTEEDLIYRKTRIGASDAGAIMHENKWCTPLKLWKQKNKLIPPDPVTPKMQKGIDFEPEARDAFIQLTGIKVKPRRIEHPTIPYMFATYDGITDCEGCLVEIKSVSFDSSTLAKAKNNEVVSMHYAQVQHQIEVPKVKPKESYYWVYDYDNKNGFLVEVKPNRAYIDELLKKEAEFYKCLMDWIEPEYTIKDYEQRNDPEWLDCAERYQSAKKSLSLYEEEVEGYRKKLIALSGGSNSMGGGITLSKGLRKGAIPYASITEVKALDLEKHRKSPTEYWRVS